MFVQSEKCGVIAGLAMLVCIMVGNRVYMFDRIMIKLQSFSILALLCIPWSVI